MNDGKFKLVILDPDGKEIEITGLRPALIKMSNGEVIPEDEPVHIFRARDCYALQALCYYKQISIEQGCNDYHEDGVTAQIERFLKWESDHPEKMKIPGITRGL